MRCIPLLALLATTTALLSGCSGTDLPTAAGPDATSGSDRVRLNATTDATSGFLLFEVADPLGLNGSIALHGTMLLTDFVPLQATLIAPNGAVHPVLRGAEFDASHQGAGDGVVYAGARDATVVSPSIVDGMEQTVPFERDVDLPDWTSAHLLVLWAAQPEPPAFTSSWRAGTQVHEVARGEVATFELKDLQGGVRVGTPAVGLSLADGQAWDAAQLWLDVRVFRSNQAFGELGVTSGGERQAVSLTYECAVQMCGGDFEVRRVHASSLGALSVDALAYGETRSLKVLGTVALLPVAVLPAVWQDVPDAFP